MGVNLMKLITDQVGGSLIKQATGMLGESESNVASAMSGIMPSLLGTLINKSGTLEGAGSLLNLLNNDADDSILDNIGGLFGDKDKTAGLMNQGGGLLNTLLGDKLGPLANLLTNFSGMKSSNTSSLLKLAAPFLIGFVKRQVMKKAMGPSGLMSFLGGQKKNVAAAIPSGLSGVSDLLGFGDFNKDEVVQEVKKAAAPAKKKASWMPILLGALAVLAGLYFMKGRGGSGIDAVDRAANTVTDATDKAMDKTKDIAGSVSDAAKNALANIKFSAGSIGEKMSGFLSSGEAAVGKTFQFNNLTFATGSAGITPETFGEVQNLAAVLKAYPDVKVKIVGHTDNTGNADANMTLSTQRAEMVMSKLTNLGVDASRMSAEGMGQTQPAASNDTEEGRRQNRRIEVVIVE